MLEKLIELAKKVCEEELEWNEDTSIMMDMQLSSLEFFSFIADVEAVFKIRISERQLTRIDTLGDLAELIQRAK